MDERVYTLGYPNNEVKTAFLELLLHAYGKMKDGEEKSLFLLLSEYLAQEAYDAFFEIIRAIFTLIADPLSARLNEAWFHTIFYLMVRASGVNTHNEVLTNRGRMDLVIT